MTTRNKPLKLKTPALNPLVLWARLWQRVAYSASILLMVWCVGLWSIPAHAQTNGEFLPPELAFAFKASMSSPNTVKVQFTIAPNYYMYRDEFAFKVVSSNGEVVQAGSLAFPKALIEFDPNFNKDMAIYVNAVSLNVPIQNKTAQEALFKIVVTSRGCAKGGLCYPPRQTQAVLTAAAQAVVSDKAKEVISPQKSAAPTPNTSTASVAPSKVSEQTTATETAPLSASTVTASTNTPVVIDNTTYSQNIFQNNSGAIALILVFGLGVLLALTPCMLPMYPILTTILSGQQDTRRMRSTLLAFAYVTGMAVVYALVGIVAAKTGAGLYRYMQSPWVLGVFTMLLVLLALSMFDVFHIQLPAQWQAWIQHKTQGKSGYTGAMMLGAASALIASPCVTAPLIGLVGFIVQTGDVFKGGVALLVLAYGMGLPLILIGAGLGRWLPKSGAWMIRIKQLIGVVMLLAALWVSQPLWYKTWLNAIGDTPVTTFTPVTTATELQRKINQSDKPVFVDIYADWCRSCIEMERKVFPDTRVQAAFGKMTLLRVDMTKFSDEDAAILNSLKLYGPPAMLVFEPVQGREVMRIIGFQEVDAFTQSLNQALSNTGQ
ncbi:MAG: protein-disulfide reductase DsbD [Burkholderiales bacterium]|nr:protein-disulfide reductase DsbD [Burkholderiales bacterium]